MKEIRRMDYPNLTVIMPESLVSTYKLIDACEKVIAFGSSTGIESAYWNTPSILYGRGFYESLGSVYTPASFGELIDLVDDPDLPPLPLTGALKYGFYMSVFGKKTEYFNFKGLMNSTYKGKRIRVIYCSTFPLMLRYLSRFGLWKRLHRIYYGKGFGLKSLTRYK